ncbi:kinesin light chain 1, partial [Paraphoma chrysanthemicola]
MPCCSTLSSSLRYYACIATKLDPHSARVSWGEHAGAVMRLLEHLSSGDFEVTSFNDENPPPYAILSHTWTEGQEVTYNELVAGTGKDKTGYDKIRFCGGRAAADGLQYFWVDTCCIDKSTSHELSTAINSMFRWYQRASKCYVYLSDIVVPEEVADAETFRITWAEAFRRSRWFTRGWTLQELLAPPCVEFFSKNGKRLGSRISLEQEIHEITKIATGALRGQSLAEFSVEDRMSWAARRTTTLKEDKVYCLLGIFGVFLSLIYGEGEAYATLRLREAIERQQEGQGIERPHGLSVLSVLPFPRNELFVGREEQLRSLEQSLLPSNTHRRMTIYGLGGCGKSALALEFAYRALVRHARQMVFWVPAISQESFELAYREIGVRLGVPGITEDNADIRMLVKNALSSESLGDWLMVVDNADDSGVLLGTTDNDAMSTRLSDYLPHSSNGTILFTTRSRKVARDLTPNSVLELNDMSEAEAKQLLARRLTKRALLDDETAVDELLAILTYLPLAIAQAAAFINNNNVSVSGYISLFQHTGTGSELFSERFEDPSRYREMDSTVAKTWHISFDQIQRQDRLAADYLSFMACIDRVDIPQSLLPPGNSLVQQVKALGTLAGYAFITERQQTAHELDQERFFDMHRLVHMASAWWLDGHNERATWAGRAVARLEELVPYGGHERKEVWTPYLSHAIYVAGLSDTVENAARASLLDRVGRCQVTLGQYSAAGTTHQRALSLREKSLGKKHIRTLVSMHEVGLAFGNLGRYEEAEAMNRRTLALSETVHGREHPSTLATMNNLAIVLRRQGKYETAEAMNRQTLALQETVLGREHPETLTTMSNLAGVLDHQGKYEAAEAMNRQTLALQETVLGSEHPETLTTMSNLALVLDHQGKYEAA